MIGVLNIVGSGEVELNAERCSTTWLLRERGRLGIVFE